MTDLADIIKRLKHISDTADAISARLVGTVAKAAEKPAGKPKAAKGAKPSGSGKSSPKAPAKAATKKAPAKKATAARGAKVQ